MLDVQRLELPAARMRRAYDALLTGVPFGVFKVAAGWVLGGYVPMLGVMVMIWGGIDILLNLLAIAIPDGVSYCLLSNLGKRRGDIWEDRGLALDMFLSFAIVATLIGFKLLPTLPAPLWAAYDASVIANVLGAGLDRLYRAWSPSAG